MGVSDSPDNSFTLGTSSESLEKPKKRNPRNKEHKKKRSGQTSQTQPNPNDDPSSECLSPEVLGTTSPPVDTIAAQPPVEVETAPVETVERADLRNSNNADCVGSKSTAAGVRNSSVSSSGGEKKAKWVVREPDYIKLRSWERAIEISRSEALDKLTNSEALNAEAGAKTFLDPAATGFFACAELKAGVALPPAVDPARKEEYLRDEEFRALFGTSKEAFRELPKWKRAQHKERVGLF